MDIIDILYSINVPTLILQRTNDIDVKIEEGKLIAKSITGAKFVELDGVDHLFRIGNKEEVLEKMRSFILNVKPKENHERKLFAILTARTNTKESAIVQQEFVNQFVTKF